MIESSAKINVNHYQIENLETPIKQDGKSDYDEPAISRITGLTGMTGLTEMTKTRLIPC